MRSPALGRRRPTCVWRRAGWPCPAPPPQPPGAGGPASPPGSRNRPARRRAAAPPGTATPTWPGSWARPPWPPPRPTTSLGDTFLGERFRRIARRRGKKKAIVAVGRSILVIVWQLLSDPHARFHDLGAEFYDNRTGPDRKKRNHIRQLEALGYKVTLEPAA